MTREKYRLGAVICRRWPSARITHFAVCQDAAGLEAITDAVSWSKREHAAPNRVRYARSSLVVVPRQRCLGTMSGRIPCIFTGGANMERGRPVAEGFVSETTGDGIADDLVPTTPSVQVTSRVRPAFRDRSVAGDVLADAGEIEGVEPAK